MDTIQGGHQQCLHHKFHPHNSVEKTENQVSVGAGLNDKPTSSGDSSNMICCCGWSLVVLDSMFIWLQGELDMVLQGWRQVHK